MLDVVVEGFLSAMAKQLATYGITYDSHYNSDLDLITQYSQSLNLRSMFASSDLSLIPQDLVEKLKGDSYNHLMYNYSPFRRQADRMNNINFEAVFDKSDEEASIGEMSKLRKIAEDVGVVSFFQALRDIPDDVDSPAVRDMVMGEVDLTFKVLSYRTDFIQKFQFIHVKNLQRNIPIEVSMDFGSAGKHEFEYEVEFQEIDGVGHVDYARFGNLQQLTFSVKVKGPFFSFYQRRAGYIKEIALELKFSSNESSQ